KEPEDERARRHHTPDRQRDSAPLVPGHTRTYLARRQADRWGVCDVRAVVAQRRASPPLHSHPQDESCYVLDGEVTAWIEEEARQCRTGAMAFAPGGTPHNFHVESDTARMLVLSTPAGI